MATAKRTGPVLPQRFVERMGALLEDELSPFVRSFEGPSTRGLRLDPAKVSAAELERLLGVPLTPVPWCPTGFVLPPDTPSLWRHPAHTAGLFYLQEPSSMSVPEILDPPSGALVADLAAAPGGKTTHLSALVGASGTVLANDVSDRRLAALHENLDLWGARNVATTRSTLAGLRAAGPFFDGVVLDAPCTGEGLFRRRPHLVREWTDGRVAGAARRQAELLREAADLVRPGGVLVYSTCSFEVEENEQQVADFVAASSEWTLESALMDPSVSPGCRVADSPTELTARIWPHRTVGEGQFVARLRRSEEPVTGTPRLSRSTRAADDGAELVRDWRLFCERVLPASPLRDAEVAARGERVFLVADLPATVPPRAVRRPGLPLGGARGSRFEPSLALAHALAPDDVENRVGWGLDDPRLADYLAGAAVPDPGADGWVLVCLERWPLAWGRRVGGVVKNFVPKRLRAR